MYKTLTFCQFFFRKKRHEEVHSKFDALDYLLHLHAAVADSNIQAKHLLELKLDGGLDLINFRGKILLLLHKCWELTGLVKAWTKQTRNLLDQRLGRQELVVLLSCRGRGTQAMSAC